MEERLQKILAQAGIASRRKCEDLIVNGQVAVDGTVVTELGVKVDPIRQKITVNGEPISRQTRVAVMLHKPTSYVTTVRDPEGRRTVMELVQAVSERVYPVGRLDYDSTGLLLLTNDGELTQRLIHPSHHVDKTYRVTVLGMPEKETLERLRHGIRLEDGLTSPCQVYILRGHPMESVCEITIHEGRKHQVKRMFEAVGHPVHRLKRVRFGPLDLGPLSPGQWRPLTQDEWEALYKAVNLTVPPYPGQQTVKPSPSPRESFASSRSKKKRR